MRTARDHDAQRADRSARPARKIVEIERHGRRKVRDLRRHRWYSVPWIVAEERHPNFRENTRFGQAAELPDRRECALHFTARRIHTEHFERDVRFDRRAEIRGALVIKRPRSVFALVMENMADRAVPNRFDRNSQKAQEQHVLCRHRDVGLELVRPPARGSLPLQQPVYGCG